VRFDWPRLVLEGNEVFERLEVFIKTFLPSFFLIPYMFKSHFFLRRVLCAITVRRLSSSSFRRAIEGGFIIISDH
jgi:hypothetical protein